MTLSIHETGIRHKCSNCHTKTVATSHNGNIIARAGKQVVMGPTLTVSCPGCGHLNHISLVESDDVVR